MLTSRFSFDMHTLIKSNMTFYKWAINKYEIAFLENKKNYYFPTFY
jgi:hypothetical protein